MCGDCEELGVTGKAVFVSMATSKIRKKSPYYGPGYVYVLRIRTGYFKIGQTINPSGRFKKLRREFKFTVVCMIPSNNPPWLERYLHKQFVDKKVPHKNDWFDLCPKDLTFLRRFLSE